VEEARPPTADEINAVLDVKKRMGFVACNIENVLTEMGMRIPHNRIHRILLQEGFAKNGPEKGRRRKWIRYERRHSNSMWHADWTKYGGNNILLIEDDASRLITGYIKSKTATTDITIAAFDSTVENWGKRREVLTDRGTQFCADETEKYMFREHTCNIRRRLWTYLPANNIPNRWNSKDDSN
jgi:putative transposase